MSLALLAGFASRADIDEAWLHRAELPPTARPLLALVLDRSAATSASVAVREDYDPARNYGDEIVDAPRCDPAKAYFRRGAGAPPDCARQAGIDLAPRDAATGLHCAAALAPLATQGFFVASRAAQWQAGTGGGHWDALRDESAAAVECRADRGRHGATAGDWYAADGGVTPWTRDSTEEIPWDFAPFADSHVFFSGNYLNYLRTSLPITDRPTAEVMARRLAAALAATTELDVALLRVDDDGPQGGYVARAPVSSEIAAGEVMALAAAAPAGAAPLAETLTEAARWLAGAARRFGLDARTDAAALDPRAPAAYVSPFDHACRPVSLGFLTVGVASDDDLAVTAAESLPRFREETGGCGTDCLATLAAWLGDTDLRDDLPGTQSAPVSWLLPSLLPDPLAFVDLVAKAHQRDAAVAAGPQLSAAALMPFDPRTGAPGVVYGLMAPRPRERWTGNLLPYALRAPTGPFEPPLVVDRDGAPAIDATGLPAAGTQSLWSDTPDANLLTGGAAGRLPTPDARNLFVNVASDRLTDPANQLAPGNARIDREALGLGALDAETPDGLVATFVAERSLGDPGLDAPLIAEYPAAGMRIAFSADQDGFLHAFEADSGVELWAWMPKELLGRVPRLARNAPTTTRSHGIDGPLVLHRHDPDGDGRIVPADGEHLWLLFGLGRGGSRYYALDVALPRDPKLLWTFELEDPLSSSLVEPVVARLDIAGSGQSAGEWVVVLAGGYDRRFDARNVAGSAGGGSLMAVDAETGGLLWSAGGGDRDLAIAGLSSVAAAPRLLDLDGDGAIDRAYAVDLTGDLWRIDFEGGRDASGIAAARRIARLGGDGRRFHFTPDASIVRTGLRNRLAIAVGSGWIMRPRDTMADDRMYVIYDELTDATAPELAESDLHDATDSRDGVPPDAPGWFVRLDAHGAGEKIAAPAVTFDHALRFQTYQPLPPDAAAPCGPPRSVARRYALDIRTALPHATAVDSEEDEPEETAATGLPPGLEFGFPGRWDDACEGCRPRPFGILGGETFDTGYAGDPVRTSWRKLVPPPASP